MSITNGSRHASKRRKLSHGSSDGNRPQQKALQHDRTVSDASRNDDGANVQSQRGRNRDSSKKTDFATATGGITKSSLAQLQVNELLSEIRPDYDQILKDLRPVSEKLIATIKSITERNALSFSEAEQHLRKQSSIAIPFSANRPKKDAQYKFEFKTPESVFIRGGLVHHLTTRHELDVEIAVLMPSVMFQEKDYLNYRAFHKRAYYIACIAADLNTTLEDDFRFRYELLNGNDLAPVIHVISLDKSLKSVRVFVNAVFPKNVGSNEKMLPSRSCVRLNHEVHPVEDDQSMTTPYYNSTTRLLAATRDIDQLLSEVGHKCDAFADTCSLGQTWLHQRGFSSDISGGGFGLFEWAYMCALLLKGGGHKSHPLFSERYSSVQLFKAMLQVLANRDLNDPLVVQAETAQLGNIGIPIMFDGANAVNVLFKMTRWSYDMLKHEAQLSLTAMNSRARNNFEASFITKVAEPSLQFDEIYLIDTATISSSRATAEPHNLISKIYKILRKGLGDRVSMLSLKQAKVGSWSLRSSTPKEVERTHEVEVRLLVNSDAANRLIDHGPSAEQQEEAKDFRDFWGEKSELRRFRDGSITETLVWSSGQSVVLQIIQYLLASHLQISPSSIQSKTPELNVQRLGSNMVISANDAFTIINNKYQELSSKLHQMEGLPLPIRSVAPVGSALRSATLGHPLGPGTSAPIDILIQFDSSGRWPDHLVAVQHTKVAFLVKISDLITEADSILKCRVGVEATNSSDSFFDNTAFVDIIAPSSAPGMTPIVFRLRIHHERELQLLQNHLADKTLPPPRRDAVSSALVRHKRMFVASPVHTSSIRNLITHFQPLSTTIRLLKSWFVSHSLSNHIPDPIIEIIAAHVFLRPYPWSAPGSASTAFLRCLHVIAHWDWAFSPLIVDLGLAQDMTAAQLSELETRFQAWRKLDPNMNTVAWFVGTNIDNTGTIWTQGAAPARVVAGRVTALAKAAISLVKTKNSDMSDEDWESLFVSPLNDFDFVISLKASIVRGGKGKAHRNSDAKFKNLQVQEALDIGNIGHDVVSLYLEDLEKAFSNVMVLFYGHGEKHIAGLWRPSLTTPKDWRVRLGYSSVPQVENPDQTGEPAKEITQINKEGILAEIALLGEGMIEKITVKK